jgi:hypothetical protein
MPIQSAGVSGSGDRFIPSWRPNKNKKRTLITTMGAKIQAFDIFQIPLSSHYPLPLRDNIKENVRILHIEPHNQHKFSFLIRHLVKKFTEYNDKKQTHINTYKSRFKEKAL